MGKMPLCFYLLSSKNCGVYQVLPFIVSQNTLPIRNKLPNREFYWSADHKYFPDWESEIVNQSADKFVRKLVLLLKN